MGASKMVFPCIKMKTVDYVQRWVIKRSDMPQSLEKQIISKTTIFLFCLPQPQTHDQSMCVNVYHSKPQFLARRNLRSTQDV